MRLKVLRSDSRHACLPGVYPWGVPGSARYGLETGSEPDARSFGLFALRTGPLFSKRQRHELYEMP